MFILVEILVHHLVLLLDEVHLVGCRRTICLRHNFELQLPTICKLGIHLLILSSFLRIITRLLWPMRVVLFWGVKLLVFAAFLISCRLWSIIGLSLAALGLSDQNRLSQVMLLLLVLTCIVKVLLITSLLVFEGVILWNEWDVSYWLAYLLLLCHLCLWMSLFAHNLASILRWVVIANLGCLCKWPSNDLWMLGLVCWVTIGSFIRLIGTMSHLYHVVLTYLLLEWSVLTRVCSSLADRVYLSHLYHRVLHLSVWLLLVRSLIAITWGNLLILLINIYQAVVVLLLMQVTFIEVVLVTILWKAYHRCLCRISLLYPWWNCHRSSGNVIDA